MANLSDIITPTNLVTLTGTLGESLRGLATSGVERMCALKEKMAELRSQAGKMVATAFDMATTEGGATATPSSAPAAAATPLEKIVLNMGTLTPQNQQALSEVVGSFGQH